MNEHDLIPRLLDCSRAPQGLSNLCIFSTYEPHLRFFQCRVGHILNIVGDALTNECHDCDSQKKKVLVPETGINAGMNTGIKYQTSLV